MSLDQIEKDITLLGDWNDVERAECGDVYRWSSESSIIKLNDSHKYSYLKMKIRNACTFIKDRKLEIKIDGGLMNEYVFYTEFNSINVKIPVKNVKEIEFVCKDVYIPAATSESTDIRKFGFIFSSIWVGDDLGNEQCINISKFEYKNKNIPDDLFIDSSLYNFKICSISTERDKPNIFYIGQYGTSGYASAAKGYIYRYISSGYNITWEPLYFDESTLSDDCPYNIIAKSAIGRKLSFYNLKIFHSTPDLWKDFNTKLNKVIKKSSMGAGNTIGYTVWETNILPPIYVDNINSEVEEVWCPSKYNEEVFKNSGVTIPIRVVPHVATKKQLINRDLIGICDSDGNLIKNNDDFTFYTIGEFNGRKGIDDLLHCFCQTFSSTDKVRLLIKTHYKGYLPKNKKFCIDKINEILKNYPNPPRIYYFIDNMCENDILALHSLGDCYISLTKSEGFGLTIFDAFNYGKKIITTGYSGQLDYLGDKHEGLVKYKLDYVSNMKEFSTNYSEDTIWAYPDLDQAKELMTNIVTI